MNLVTQLRRGHLLRHIDLTGRGLEIGPYDQPTVLKSEADIRYLDWKTREQLVAECQHPDLVPDIPEIDYVVQSNDYRQYVPDTFDFIIANHVLEHAPNLIQWLQDINAMLREDGVLFLALPDKRFSFDRYRPDTALSHFVAEHLTEVKDIPVEHHIEVEMYYDMQFIGKPMDVAVRLDRARIAHALAPGPHVGIHSHVFRSSTVLDKVLKPLLLMGYLRFRIVDFVPARAETGGEMLIVLRKGDPDVALATQAFFTDDDAPLEAAERAELQGRIALLERRAESADSPDASERAELQDRIALLQRRAELAEARVSALQASTSWRVTAPLRALRRLVR